jgi:hypothetical protein
MALSPWQAQSELDLEVVRRSGVDGDEKPHLYGAA